MDLTDKLYDSLALKNAETRWKTCPFWFFSPEMNFYRFKSVYDAIENKDNNYFMNNIGSVFFPETSLKKVQQLFNSAINRGVDSVNYLLNNYLKDLSSLFHINEIPLDTDHYLLNKKGREKWIEARNGKHSKNWDCLLLRESYDTLRKIGLGYLVSLIDSSPEILNSLIYLDMIKGWFNKQFNFKNRKNSGLENINIPSVWNTKIGIKVYGDESPIKCRAKVLGKNGNLIYSSLLMKILKTGRFMDNIFDNLGAEFIVSDEQEQKKLIDYLHDLTGTLERYKSIASRKNPKVNFSSSDKFSVKKFIIRPPVKIKLIKPYNKIGFLAKRIPLEVQIFTLDGHEARLTDPDVTHENYKRKQFYSVFPMLFPEKLYRSLIEQNIS